MASLFFNINTDINNNIVNKLNSFFIYIFQSKTVQDKTKEQTIHLFVTYLAVKTIFLVFENIICWLNQLYFLAYDQLNGIGQTLTRVIILCSKYIQNVKSTVDFIII